MIFELRQTNQGIDTISAWEIKENAIDDPKVRQIIDDFSRVFLVYVRRYKSEKRRVIGPAKLMSDLKIIEYS